MDNLDLSILEILKENGRATASDISRRVKLSVPAVSERMRKLEESGIIQEYTVRINREELGYKLLSIIFVNIGQTGNIQGFRSVITKYPEVIECHHMAGEYDYMLKVLLRDTSELEEFISRKLKSIKGVEKSNTQVVLSTLKETINR
jgi:Lrp/AsnC family leucine-responsive transcriptional regulator